MIVTRGLAFYRFGDEIVSVFRDAGRSIGHRHSLCP
jgi:hypothetical protein